MIFPALKPSRRSFTPGLVPMTSFRSMSGKETRVITGSVPVSHSCSIGFQNIGEDTAKQILDHWYGRQGTALAFTLPAEVWAGWSDYLSAVTAEQEWRYAEVPQIESVSPGIMTAAVQLVALI